MTGRFARPGSGSPFGYAACGLDGLRMAHGSDSDRNGSLAADVYAPYVYQDLGPCQSVVAADFDGDELDDLVAIRPTGNTQSSCCGRSERSTSRRLRTSAAPRAIPSHSTCAPATLMETETWTCTSRETTTAAWHASF